MTESWVNRGWLISNRMARRGSDHGSPRGESPETLLYYQNQLEAELEEVRRRIAELVRR
jgi:hypothetical protein